MASKVKDICDIAGTSYTRKWVILSILIGIASGIGSIIFNWSLSVATQILLGLGAGFIPPAPTGEGATSFFGVAKPWAIPILTTAGGLLCGLIVFRFAPEAKGSGQDAVIAAFHNQEGIIRHRVPVVRAIASAITIGSGGSAGREGPAAQISAGIACILADLFNLSSSDRRIAITAGIGAGIGSIFKSPLGGAILSMEILYRRDFEYEAILPSFIASVVGYSVFASWNGWGPIFGIGTVAAFQRLPELLSYSLLGVSCGLVGIVYGRSFHFLQNLFEKAIIPEWAKPALGGFLVGLIAIFMPQVLGMGYGWLQFAINGDYVSLPVTIMLAVAILKILTTGLTVGSGGSGGVFAPGLVIGGMTGGVLWKVLSIYPAIIPSSPAAFVIVGMMALFGGIAKAPLAMILMVTEMTMDYTFLIPSMLVCSIAYFVSKDCYIFDSQVDARGQSLAHRHEYSIMLLKTLKVDEAMTTSMQTISSSSTVDEVADLLERYEIHAVPVVDEDKLVGIVAKLDAVKSIHRGISEKYVNEIMSSKLVVTYPKESLFDAMNKMIANHISQLPVVERDNPDQIIGLLSMEDVTAIQCQTGAGKD